MSDCDGYPGSATVVPVLHRLSVGVATVMVPAQVPLASIEYPDRSSVPTDMLLVGAMAGEFDAIGPAILTVPVAVSLMPVSVAEFPRARMEYAGIVVVERGATTSHVTETAGWSPTAAVSTEGQAVPAAPVPDVAS